MMIQENNDNIRKKQALIEEEVEELKRQQQIKLQQMSEEHEQKIREIVQHLNVVPETKEEAIENEMKKYENLKKEIEKHYDKQMEIEHKKQTSLETEIMKDFKKKENQNLKEKLTKMWPIIIEVNLIASELKRKIKFSIHISYFYIDFENIKRYQNQKKYRMKVKVENFEKGYFYYWDLAKFSDRYFLIKELYEEYYDLNKKIEITDEEDPFWDPPQHQKVGEGFLKLMSLSYLLDNPNQLILLGDEGEGQSGTLNVNLLPLDSENRPIDQNNEIFDDFVDDPSWLIGKELRFMIHIGSGQITSPVRKNPYVKYRLMLPNKNGKLVSKDFKTHEIKGNKKQFSFDYQKVHVYKEVNSEILLYLNKHNLCFEIYAKQERMKTMDEQMFEHSIIGLPFSKNAKGTKN